MEELMQELYAYLQTNKAMLVNSQSFTVLLELGHLMSVTAILSLEKLKYYKTLLARQYSALFSTFSFMFKSNEEEYLKEYRKSLGEKELVFLSVEQERINSKNWLEMYK